MIYQATALVITCNLRDFQCFFVLSLHILCWKLLRNVTFRSYFGSTVWPYNFNTQTFKRFVWKGHWKGKPTKKVSEHNLKIIALDAVNESEWIVMNHKVHILHLTACIKPQKMMSFDFKNYEPLVALNDEYKLTPLSAKRREFE